MFRTFKNIDGAFRQVRLVSVLMVVACVLISLFSIHAGMIYAKEAQGRIYVLANGKVLEAVAADRKENVPVEARDHIGVFHQLFFSLDPDEKVIMGNVSRALYLADGSAKVLYDNLKEAGYYAGVISGNISQSLEVDSIRVELGVYPYYFQLHGTERIIRATSITTRSLVTEGYVRNVGRSDHNPHGFLIERLRVLENLDVKTQSRP